MITTGVDIVKISRIKDILNKNSQSFYKKIFNKEEIEYIKGKSYNPRTVAGLFASKEAVSKALGTGIGKVKWKDIKVLHDSNGKPYIRLSDNVNDILNDLKINKLIYPYLMKMNMLLLLL